MNPSLIEGMSETAPLKPTTPSKSSFQITEVGRSFGTTYFLMYEQSKHWKDLNNHYSF